jgi:hypothetical protein
VSWDFGNLDSYFENPQGLEPAWIDSWLASAAVSGAAPLRVGDPVLANLLGAAEGDLTRFAKMAAAALDHAASRGVAALDAEAEDAGRAAIVESE